MTQKEFNDWPLLLRAWHLRQLGVAKDALRTLRTEHPEIVAKQCGKGSILYLKGEVAKLFRLKAE